MALRSFYGADLIMPFRSGSNLIWNFNPNLLGRFRSNSFTFRNYKGRFAGDNNILYGHNALAGSVQYDLTPEATFSWISFAVSIDTFSTNTTIINELFVGYEVLPNLNLREIFRIGYNGVGNLTIETVPDQVINNRALRETSSQKLEMGIYRRITLEYEHAGAITLKVDGDTWLTYTGIDFRGPVHVVAVGNNMFSTVYVWDDIYMTDNLGPAPFNQDLGDVRVATLFPAQDILVNNWSSFGWGERPWWILMTMWNGEGLPGTPNYGYNYREPLDSTSYPTVDSHFLQATTVGSNMTFGIAPVNNPLEILAVNLFSVGRRGSGVTNDVRIRHGLRDSEGNIWNAPDNRLLETTWTPYITVVPNAPDGTPWAWQDLQDLRYYCQLEIYAQGLQMTGFVDGDTIGVLDLEKMIKDLDLQGFSGDIPNSWNSAAVSAGTILQNDNTTVTTTSTSTTRNSARSLYPIPRNAKVYWEERINADPYGNSASGIGTLAHLLTNFPGQDLNGYGFNTAGFILHNNITTVSAGLGDPINGDILRFAIDTVNWRMFVGLNGNWMGDPVSGTGQAYNITPADYYAICQVRQNGDSRTARFNPLQWTFAAPEGYGPSIFERNQFGAPAIDRVHPLQTEATDLFTRMTVAPSTADQRLYNDLIWELKDAGLWTKLDALYLLAAHDAQAARLNIVQNAFNLSMIGDGIYFEPNQYARGDSTTASRLATGFNPSSTVGRKFLQNSAHMMAWTLTAATIANSQEIGIVTGLGARIQLSATSGNIRMNSGTSTSYATGATVGMHFANRLSSSQQNASRNKAVYTNGSVTSAAPVNAEITLLGGSANVGSSHVAAGSFGSGMTVGEKDVFYDIVRKFLLGKGLVV